MEHQHITPARHAVLAQRAAADCAKTAREYAAASGPQHEILAAYYQQKSAMLYRYARHIADMA